MADQGFDISRLRLDPSQIQQVDPNQLQPRRDLKAETLQDPNAIAWGQQISQANYRHELGVGDQIADTGGAAVDQLLRHKNFNGR